MANPIQATTTGAERPGVANGHTGLQIREDGFALIRERLRAANRDNPDFEAQADDLFGIVRMALDELRRGFGDGVVLVIADGEWAHEGIDLRTLPDAEGVIVRVVTHLRRRSYAFEAAVGRALFPYMHNRHFLLQVDFVPLPFWTHALDHQRAPGGSVDALGIPLLTQA